ncbi:dihydroorotate dehydrogenase electron transfer subunit [Paraburkholderia sp. ZP32-5]|uniref:dihydroorotate dehydrogenase electron transfer subunit n=1 Tax=Paraburkholderia sp. ZP32-5 TaxID=2883245 RepID=UPI001F488402|nr:dihydroorotate dehydrogenase electron transfer subunit [Paraburkholderia sp. ZP32-5]
MTAHDNVEPEIVEHLCEVISNEPVNAEYRHLILLPPHRAALALPGQFFHLQCGDAFLRRPMSVYRAAPDQLEFLYKVHGAGTQALAALRPKDILNALGPLGKGFAPPAATKHVLLIARGVGLATLCPLAAHSAACGAEVTAVLSARTRALVMSEARLRESCGHVEVVSDEDGTSDIKQLEEQLRWLHAARPFDYIATCGSKRITALMHRLASEWGIAGEVAVEQRMGCGVGSCYACVLPMRTSCDDFTYKRVCWDGPVFNLREVA